MRWLLLLLLLITLTGCTRSPLESTSQGRSTVSLPAMEVTPALRAMSSAIPQSTMAALQPSVTALLPTAIAAPTPSAIPAPLPLPTLAALVEPDSPLEQELAQYSANALLYTRPDRFLVLGDGQGRHNLWLTSGICNMENDSTEQRAIWSADGRYLAISCNREPGSDMILTTVLDTQTGQPQPLDLPVGEVLPHQWSPGAQRLLIRALNGSEWYVYDAETGRVDTLLSLRESHAMAAWSPDGQRVALVGKHHDDQDAIIVVSYNGTQLRQYVIQPVDGYEGLGGALQWSADGRTLLFNRQVMTETGSRIYEAIGLNLENGTSDILATNRFSPLEFIWSPDGHWLFMGYAGQAGSHLGRWSLYRADGRLERVLSSEPDRDDSAIQWLPDSQGYVLFSVHLHVGVELRLGRIDGTEQVLARFLDTGPALPTLAISPDRTLIAAGLSERGIVILDRQGQQLALLPGRINMWRP